MNDVWPLLQLCVIVSCVGGNGYNNGYRIDLTNQLLNIDFAVF